MKDSQILIFNKNNVVKAYDVENLSKILYYDSNYIIVNTDDDSGKCIVYSYANTSGVVVSYHDPIRRIAEFDSSLDKAIMLDGYLILFDKKINIFNKNFEKISEIEG